VNLETLSLHAASEFLRSQPSVNKKRIAAMGWCMAGGYSPDVALEEPRLAAAVINHRHLATDPEAFKKISAPIFGRFGGQDHGITPDDVDKFEAAMKQQGKKLEIKIYDDAGPACENPNNHDGYRPADDADAAGNVGSAFWRRTCKTNFGALRSRVPATPFGDI
jgi:carboxymethylenebutenolidase